MRKKWFLLGCLCIFVPVLFQGWKQKQQEQVVTTFHKELKSVDEIQIERVLQEAREYNLKLFQTGVLDKRNYKKQLNLLGTGIMASLEIPRIGVKLPIYHGTEEGVLKEGAGHMQETSLPIGGENTHCVLAGHSGMSSAKMFTRLDELQKGDVFLISVCNQTLCYQVCEIRTVRPDNEDVIKIQEGKDRISLITCTPYGLNTHRLVVTGERITKEEVQEEKVQEEKVLVQRVSKRERIWLGGVILVVVIGVYRRLRK